MMLARVADSLYWIGRYVERAEHMCRLCDVMLTATLDRTDGANQVARIALAAVGDGDGEASQDPFEAVVKLVLDREDLGSIASSLALARENARQVRDQITTETWERLNLIYLRMSDRNAEASFRDGSQAFLHDTIADLTVDGADEVDPAFNLIKGGGGALLREKVVAHISKREAVVVGRAKLVERLGTTFLLPVEVVPFARPVVAREISKLGADPILRQSASGEPYMTDNGNEILDCTFPEGIPDPAAVETDLDRIPGVVESGLFVGLAHVCVVGDEDGGCEVRERS